VLHVEEVLAGAAPDAAGIHVESCAERLSNTFVPVERLHRPSTTDSGERA